MLLSLLWRCCNHLNLPVPGQADLCRSQTERDTSHISAWPPHHNGNYDFLEYVEQSKDDSQARPLRVKEYTILCPWVLKHGFSCIACILFVFGPIYVVLVMALEWRDLSSKFMNHVPLILDNGRAWFRLIWMHVARKMAGHAWHSPTYRGNVQRIRTGFPPIFLACLHVMPWLVILSNNVSSWC